MASVTFFLVVLIVFLAIGNALLLPQKRDGPKRWRAPNPALFYSVPSQVEEQKPKNFANKNNGVMLEITELKEQQASIQSRILSLEEITLALQSELNDLKDLILSENKKNMLGKEPKNSRVQILEDYLKKV